MLLLTITGVDIAGTLLFGGFAVAFMGAAGENTWLSGVGWLMMVSGVIGYTMV
jgi:hypothetical protein